MENIFIKILNMSINAGWLVIVVILLRMLLKNAPKYIRCILWALVGLRLVCPFTIESVLSLIPNAETIPPEIIYSQTPTVHIGVDVLDQAINQTVTDSLSPEVSTVFEPMRILTRIGMIVWLAGMVAMLVYTIISYAVLRRKVRISINLRDELWICDDIDSPFILGIIRPRIYVPSNINLEQLAGIAAHERAHLKRLDHWWKPLGFILLSLYWFNPLMWLAYVLFCRDIELACDELVVRKMNTEEKQEYSETLLSCSITRRNISVCPLAFGEVGVKERIKAVLDYKKPTVWIFTAAIVVCAVVSVCFLTDPIATRVDSELDAFISQSILDYGRSDHTDGHFACEAHDIIGVEQNDVSITVYALVMYQEYSFENGVIRSESGSHIPTAITVKKSDTGYLLVEYWESDNGTRYASSIRSKFPWYLANKAINIHETASEHEASCIAKAEEHYGVEYIDPYANMSWTTSARPVSDIIAAETPRTQRCEFNAQYIRTDGYHDNIDYPLAVVIRSRAELESYYQANREMYDLERKEFVYSDTTIGFLDACDRYDDYFFAENVLIMVLIEESSGSNRHKVTDVVSYEENNCLDIAIRRILPAGVGTNDMAMWHVIIEMAASDLSNNIAVSVSE